MAIQNITYNTKEALQDDETIPVENKVTADDMNEIKAVVNNNASETEVNTQNIENLDTNKVDKQIGKGLSTNDYTNEEKAQLSTNTINIATLTTESGHTFELSLNNTTFVLTANLKNKAGTIISSSNVDLPIETLVKDIQYDSTTKEIVFILQDGTTRRIPLGDLISGLQAEITVQNKLASDLVNDINQTNKFATSTEKTNWNAKYDKPNEGIPKTDLANDVQTSLDKAETAIQEHQDITGKEDKTNKVTELTSESTDTQYPSAKVVYDSQVEQDTEIEQLQTKVTNLEETVNSELEDGTAEGTEIIVNDSATADASLLPNGNTEQAQYEGYNLFESDSYPVSRTLNGVTVTNNGDGSFTLNGTCTTHNTNIQLGTTSKIQNILAESSIRHTAYYVSGSCTKAEGSSANYCVLRLNYNLTNSMIHLEQLKDAGVIYKTNSQNTTTTGWSWNITLEEGDSFNNFTLKYMLIIGTEEKAYEPYVGGQASPSEEYPQTVHVLEGSNTITIKNINLLKNTAQSKTEDGITYTVQQDKTVLVNGTALKDTTFKVNNFVFKANKTYYLKGSPEGGSSQTYRIITMQGNSVIGGNDTGNGTIRSFNVDTELAVRINVKKNTEVHNLIFKPMITEGQSLNQYIKYQEQIKTLTLPNGLEMCNIADYRDRFEKRGDNWVVPNKIQKIASYNGETITTDYISTTGGLDTGATVYYVGDTDLTITDTTLIAELDDLYETLRTYLGQTNIIVEAEDLAPMMTLNYKKSNRITIDNRITELERAVVALQSI